MTEINFGPSRELCNHDQTTGRKLTLKLSRIEWMPNSLYSQTWAACRGFGSSDLRRTGDVVFPSLGPSLHFTAAAVGHQSSTLCSSQSISPISFFLSTQGLTLPAPLVRHDVHYSDRYSARLLIWLFITPFDLHSLLVLVHHAVRLVIGSL